ncbi:MAG: DUF2992 family protein [Gammaproteobacteria bacterium]|nr:DUF2992 family protein [Gammaproteobacteria bacterium]
MTQTRTTIKVTIQFKNPYWLAIFERQDNEVQVVTRHIFVKDPNDQELYDYVANHFFEFKLTETVKEVWLDINRP